MSQVKKYHQLQTVEVNNVNNNILDSMNQEVQVRDCELYANEVHSEGMLIVDSNVDAFTKAPNEEDVQPLIQVNEESIMIANNSFIIPHQYLMDIQKSEHMQRKFKIDQAIGIHVDVEFITPNHAFMDNTLHSISRLK